MLRGGLVISKKHAPWIVGAWFLIMFLLVSPQYPLHLQSPLAVGWDELTTAPDGYKWCAGYEFLDSRLIPENRSCPNEYVCLSLNQSFTTEDEAKMACPNEWTVYSKPIIEETTEKAGFITGKEILIGVISTISLAALYIGGKNEKK